MNQPLVLYDLETNGRSPENDRILEVFIASLNSKKPDQKKTYHSYVKIGNNNIELYTFLKTRWTPAFLNENGADIIDVIVRVYEMFSEDEKALIVGYFITKFDNRFVSKYFTRYGLPEINFKDRSFDVALEYKADLLKLYDKRPRKDWRAVHEQILKNDYGKLLSQAGHRFNFESCCRYYGISFDENKLHHAEYDSLKTLEILFKQRPEWFI